MNTRSNEFLPPNIKNVIKMLTLFKDSPSKVVGSFRFQHHEHPGDIDLFEVVNHEFKSFEHARKQIVKAIKNVIMKVRDAKFVYLGDFKAGIDNRYVIEYGDFKVDSKGILKLFDYEASHIRAEIKRLRLQKLYTEKEKENLLKLVFDKPSYMQHKALVAALRKRIVLRWKIKELLQGYKNLPRGKHISLEEAISQKEMIKIDVYMFLGNRFVEITNIYFLKPQLQNETMNNFNSMKMWSKNELLQRVSTDIEIFKIPELHKHMKVAKRMWNLAYYKNDEITMQKLLPLFNSSISKLSQILSDIETMMLMIEKLANPPTKYMSRILSDILLRMGTISRKILPKQKLNEIYIYITSLTYNSKKEDYQNAFDNIYIILNSIVDINAKKFLILNKLI